MSSEKTGENPVRRKPTLPKARPLRVSRTWPRLKGVGDGQPVDIPHRRIERRGDTGRRLGRALVVPFKFREAPQANRGGVLKGECEG